MNKIREYLFSIHPVFRWLILFAVFIVVIFLVRWLLKLVFSLAFLIFIAAVIALIFSFQKMYKKTE